MMTNESTSAIERAEKFFNANFCPDFNRAASSQSGGSRVFTFSGSVATEAPAIKGCKQGGTTLLISLLKIKICNFIINIKYFFFFLIN